jgi:hypothetical protein
MSLSRVAADSQSFLNREARNTCAARHIVPMLFRECRWEREENLKNFMNFALNLDRSENHLTTENVNEKVEPGYPNSTFHLIDEFLSSPLQAQVLLGQVKEISIDNIPLPVSNGFDLLFRDQGPGPNLQHKSRLA